MLYAGDAPFILQPILTVAHIATGNHIEFVLKMVTVEPGWSAYLPAKTVLIFEA